MEMIIGVYLPFLDIAIFAATSLKHLPQKQKSPLFASGLKSLAAFCYNVAPRTSLCGLLNRYPNQRTETVPAKARDLLMLDQPFIEITITYRALVYFFRRQMTTGFYRRSIAHGYSSTAIR
jgi:hypothetical protein